MPDPTEPGTQHLKVLRHLAKGGSVRDLETHFVHPGNAIRASFECISAGWVSQDRLTPKGRAVLAEHEPAPPAPARKVEFECRVVERVRVFLAPAEGPAEVTEESR
jgi:hypothetical protein